MASKPRWKEMAGQGMAHYESGDRKSEGGGLERGREYGRGEGRKENGVTEKEEG